MFAYLKSRNNLCAFCAVKYGLYPLCVHVSDIIVQYVGINTISFILIISANLRGCLKTNI